MKRDIMGNINACSGRSPPERKVQSGFQGYSGNLMPTAKHSWGLKAARDFKEHSGKCYWL